MKRILVITAAVVAIALLTAVPQAQAQGFGDGFQYRVMNLNGFSTNAPTADVTNQVADIQVATPLAIEFFGIQPTGATVTVYRVAGGAFAWNGTNSVYAGGVSTTIGTVVTDSSGNGISTNLTNCYIVIKDLIGRSSPTATNGTIRFITKGY